MSATTAQDTTAPVLPSMFTRILETLDRANLPLLASALTFDALLALVPLAILGIAGLGLLLDSTTNLGTSDPGLLLMRLLPAHVHGIESDPFGLVEGLIDKI